MMKAGRLSRILAGILTLSLALPLSAALAGTTGKITGRVVDDKEGALPGASVLIEGTKRGAVTDKDGYYTILSVDPGTHSLTASLIGYTKLTKRGVEVSIDYTTTVDFRLKEEAVQVAEVVVTAERPPVEKDKTSSKYVTSADEIRQIPIIKTTGELVSLQPGVDMAGTFSIRGSDISYGNDARSTGGARPRPNDAYVMIDGIRVANQDGNSAILFTGVNKSAVQQISVETGVTPAEYGDAQAGTINIVTQEGAQKYHGWTEFNFEPPGKKHWGANVYDAPQHLSNMQWKDQAWVTETDPRTGRVVHQRADYTKWAGFTVEGSMSGPLGPNASFLASIKHERRAARYPAATSHGFFNDRGQYINAPNNVQGSASVTFKPGATTKVKGGVVLQRYVAYQGEVSEGGRGDEGLIRGMGFSGRNLFLPDNWSAAGKYLHQEELAYLTFTHTLSPKTFYEVRVARGRTLQDTVGVPSWTEDPRRDRANWFVIDRRTAMWIKSDRERWSVKADLSSQVTKGHFVKGGVEAMRYDAFYTYWAAPDKRNNIFTFYSGGDRPYEMGHPATPIRGAFYVQDKMEFQGLIANVGARVDFNHHTHKEPIRAVFVWAPMWRFYTQKPYLYGRGDASGGVALSDEFVATPPTQWKISPRLGISHPITDRMVMHFSLGRFYQWPDIYDLYAKTYSNEGVIGPDGDPTWRDVNGNKVRDPAEALSAMSHTNGGFAGDAWVQPEETLTYEVGVDWNFVSDYTASLTTFYRSETQQQARKQNQWLGVKWDGRTVRSVSNGAGGYAKGIEFAIGKRLSNYFSFRVAWTSEWTADGLMGLTQGSIQLFPDSTYVSSGKFWYAFRANSDGSETPVPVTAKELAQFKVDAATEIRNYSATVGNSPWEFFGKMEGFQDRGMYIRIVSEGGQQFGPLRPDPAAEKVGGRLGQANVQVVVSTPSNVRFGPGWMGWLASDLNVNVLYRLRTGATFAWSPAGGGQRRDRGPMDTSTDLSVEKALASKGRFRPTFFIEVRNLFNQQMDTDSGTDFMRWGLQMPRPDNPDYLRYGDPGDRSYFRAPRTANLGVRLSF